MAEAEVEGGRETEQFHSEEVRVEERRHEGGASGSSPSVLD